MGKKMEVLLLQPLAGKGNAGEVIDVKIHYANHFLFPNGVAMPYDKQAKNQRTAQMKKIESNKELLKQNISALLGQIETVGGLTFYKAATHTGGLYDSINESDIVELIRTTYQVQLDKKYFKLDEKIQALGEYSVVFTYEDKTTHFPVHVLNKEAVTA